MYYKLNLKAINLAMIKKGYSISKLSKECGLGKATISRAIRETTTPRQSTICKIAKALDVKVEELLIEIDKQRR